MTKVLEDPESLTEEEIHCVIRKGVCENKIQSRSLRHRLQEQGSSAPPRRRRQLDALPARPRNSQGAWTSTPTKRFILEPADDGPLAALAFKMMTDPYVGRLTFVRVYSGTLEKGMTLLNTTKGQERTCLPPDRDARERPERARRILYWRHRRHASALKTPAPGIPSVLRRKSPAS